MMPVPTDPEHHIRVTKWAKTYHEPTWNSVGTWCVRWRDDVVDGTLAQAIAEGFRPCKRCYK